MVHRIPSRHLQWKQQGLNSKNYWAASCLVRAQNCSREISSARAVGLSPEFCSTCSIFGAAALRLERSILRRWLNAMATVEDNNLAGAGKRGTVKA